MNDVTTDLPAPGLRPSAPDLTYLTDLIDRSVASVLDGSAGPIVVKPLLEAFASMAKSLAYAAFHQGYAQAMESASTLALAYSKKQPVMRGEELRIRHDGAPPVGRAATVDALNELAREAEVAASPSRKPS